MRHVKDFSMDSCLMTLLAVLSVGFLLFPVVFVIYYSFNSGEYFSFDLTGRSVRWYVSLFHNDRFIDAFVTSFSLAAIVTPLGLLISVPCAYALVRGDFAGQHILNAIFMSPIMIPGAVTGVSFLIFLSAIGIGPGFTGLTVALTCFTLPFAIRSLVANMHALRIDIENSARDLGANEYQVFWKVVVPQLRPGIFAGGLFIFVMAIDNFSITAFLSTYETATLPVAMYDYAKIFDDPMVAAVSGVLIVSTTVLVLLLNRIVGLEKALNIE